MDPLFFLDEAEAQVPREGRAIQNAFWVVHPQKGLVFAGNVLDAQCRWGSDAEEVIRFWAERMYPDCIVKKIFRAYLGDLRSRVHS